MILHINDRLNKWAFWCLTGRTANIGFPRKSSYCSLEGRGGNGLSAEFNDDAWEIEQAVHSLDDVLKDAVKIFYLGKGTSEQKARDCGCAKMTMYKRIDCAQRKILDWLVEYYSEKY